MIRFALRCENDHSFESWFQSAEAFDTLRSAGHLSCPECGSGAVEKALMAPSVRPARTQTADPKPKSEAEAKAEAEAAPDLTSPSNDREKAMAELRRKIEDESDYVGLNFAAEARAMHEGDIPHRPIYGQAKTDDAKKLVEDGVPVAPLPFRPKASTN